MRGWGALGLAVALAASAVGQPADSTGILVPPPDSAVAGPRPVVGFGAPPGRAVTPVPAVTGMLSAQSLLDESGVVPVTAAPAVFAYTVGAPGRVAGVSVDGLAPDAPALRLDGRPVEDLVTGRPRYDLVPFAVIGPLRLGEGAFGRAASVETGLRSFRLGVPVTELRYIGGGAGTRHASGTHAQTRRAPRFVGGDAGRLTLTGHAATRAADGSLAGAQLRHTDALARVLLTRPGLAVEAGGLYADRTEGARAGVVANVGQSPSAVFDLTTATVRQSGATRRTLRTEGWARARLGIGTELGISAVEQRLVYRSQTSDTTRVDGGRLAAFVEQPLAIGGHGLRLRADVVSESSLGGALVGDDRLGLHAVVSDSVRIGPARLAATIGGHRVGEDAWPSAAARVAVGPLSVGVRSGGRARSRLSVAGLSGRVLAGVGGVERTLAAHASLDLTSGDWRLALRAFGSDTRDGVHLVDEGDTLVASVVAPSVRQGGVRVELGWRERTRRGLYARVGGTVRALEDVGTELEQRLDEALPRGWARARIGVRAEDVGDDVLDLDLAIVVSGWTAFRSRLIEPVTGALVLPEAGAPLGIEIPARAVLGVEATATFSARASLFLRYDNALADVAYNGALVTQGEPLPAATLRFGVFWALLN